MAAIFDLFDDFEMNIMSINLPSPTLDGPDGIDEISIYEIKYFGGVCIYNYTQYRANRNVSQFEQWLRNELMRSERNRRVSQLFSSSYGMPTSTPILSAMNEYSLVLISREIFKILTTRSLNGGMGDMASLFTEVYELYMERSNAYRERLQPIIERLTSNALVNMTRRSIVPHFVAHSAPCRRTINKPSVVLRDCDKKGKEECSVCYETRPVRQFDAFDCEHSFCRNCVKKITANSSPVCPFCRKAILKIWRYRLRSRNVSAPTSAPSSAQTSSSTYPTITENGHEVVIIEEEG